MTCTGGKSTRQLLRLQTLFNLMKNFIILLLGMLLLCMCVCYPQEVTFGIIFVTNDFKLSYTRTVLTITVKINVTALFMWA